MGHLSKDYVSVASRIDKYHEDHTEKASIETTFTLQGEIAIFKAVVVTKKGTFTGSSFGKLGREKAFEKLETVAVGRALAFAGYDVKKGIASEEEMEEFYENQKLPIMTHENVHNLMILIGKDSIKASTAEEAIKVASARYTLTDEIKQLITSNFN